MSPFPRAAYRATVRALAFGIGIVGREGFALPGPLIGALFFFNGAKYYWWTALIPAAFWIFVFFIFAYPNAIAEDECAAHARFTKGNPSGHRVKMKKHGP